MPLSVFFYMLSCLAKALLLTTDSNSPTNAISFKKISMAPPGTRVPGVWNFVQARDTSHPENMGGLKEC